MVTALGSHRFNPQTGLWELVSLENLAGIEMPLPMMAEVEADKLIPSVGADDPVGWLSEPAPSDSSDDFTLVIGGQILWEPSDKLVPWFPVEDDIIFPPTERDPWSWRPVVDVEAPTPPEAPVVALPVAPEEPTPPEEPVIAVPLEPSPPQELNPEIPINDNIGGDWASILQLVLAADRYRVGDGQEIREYSAFGRDVVISSVSHTLSADAEKLALAWGAGDINGFGNDLDNILIGNEGRNILNGGAGNDLIYGASSGDTLIGGEGRDLFFLGCPGNLASQEAIVVMDFEVGVDKLSIDNNSLMQVHSLYFSDTNNPAMRQEGADTIITLTGVDLSVYAQTWSVWDYRFFSQDIRLVGVDMQSLGPDDFLVSGWSSGVGWM
jgi:hypothetical protein